MERPSHDELISAYFDGEATPEERAVVERLLADPKHRQTLEEYRQLRDELRSMPTPRLSSAWSARLRDKLADAKPGWAEASVMAPSDRAAKAPDRAASPVATVPPPFSTDGKADAAPIASLADRGPRGDGYSRFRQLWLAAGVGVAAGTLGIFIGWSAQTLRPDSMQLDLALGESEAALSTQAAAPMSASPAEGYALSESEDGAWVKGDGKGAADEAQFAPQRSSGPLVPRGVASAPTMDAPPVFAESAVAEGNAAAAVSDIEVAKAESAEGLADNRLKKSEKQTDTFTGGAPPVQMDDAVRELASGAYAWADSSGEAAIDGTRNHFFATYVGVWERPTFDAYGVAGSEADLKFQAAGEEIARQSQVGDAAVQGMVPTPSLSLEGTPEEVAEALEILSRGDDGGRVRLLKRFSEDELSRTERLRRLAESKSSAIDERLAEATSRLERESLDQVPKEIEDPGSSKFIDGVAADKLAAAETTSAIARIEAFYHDGEDRKDRQPLNALAGGGAFRAFGFDSGSGGAPGAGGFGGGLGGGGFGGGARPEATQTQNAEMDAAGPFTAPEAEAPPISVLGDLSNGAARGGPESFGSASGAMLPATPPPVPPAPAPAEVPAPAPAPVTALVEASPAPPLPLASRGGPANEPRTQAWNIDPPLNAEAATEAPRSRLPAIAGIPMPAEATPPPAAAEPVSESEAGATRQMKSNEEGESAPDVASTPMRLAQSGLEDPAAGGAPLPLEKPASGPLAGPEIRDSASSLLREEDRLELQRKRLEELREQHLRAGSARYSRGFAVQAPQPQRVRVILYPPSAFAQDEAQLAMPAADRTAPVASPAGPAAATVEPAAETAPADAAPAAPQP